MEKVKSRFIPFKNKSYISKPTIYGNEMKYVIEAYVTNWMSTIGKNIDVMEKLVCEKTGSAYGVTLSRGTSALHLYGTPCKIDEINAIAKTHGAVVIENAAEAFGAEYKGRDASSLADIGCISFNGNKIITGSTCGIMLSDNKECVEKAR